MPYYSVGRKDLIVDSTVRRMPYNTVTGGTTLVRSSFEQGFRTRLPIGDEVKEIALSVAEPYSWWVDYQATKKQGLEKTPGFDTTLIKEDKGHTWLFEQLEVKGLQNFSWNLGSEWYDFRNAYLYSRSAGNPMAVLPESSIESWAALQYGRMAPVVGEFSLSSFLGELREKLPSLIFGFLTRAQTVKNAGSDFLNVEFGWKPLLSDVRSLADTLMQASLGLYRPLGTSHRRRDRPLIESFNYADYPEGRIQAFTGHMGNPAGYNPYSATSLSWSGAVATGKGTTSWYSKQKQWVEGEFVYIPKAGFDPQKFLDRYETLANVEITPAVLWELAPWSWLVDWAGQIGQSISAMEAGLSNRVLSTYYYGMEDTFSKTVHGVLISGNQSGSTYSGPGGFQTVVERRRRRRVRANPFGYTGSSSTKLDAEKMSILAALGLTRSK